TQIQALLYGLIPFHADHQSLGKALAINPIRDAWFLGFLVLGRSAIGLLLLDIHQLVQAFHTGDNFIGTASGNIYVRQAKIAANLAFIRSAVRIRLARICILVRFVIIGPRGFVERSDFRGGNFLKRTKFADGISCVWRENGTKRNNLLVLGIVNWT